MLSYSSATVLAMIITHRVGYACIQSMLCYVLAVPLCAWFHTMTCYAMQIDYVLYV